MLCVSRLTARAPTLCVLLTLVFAEVYVSPELVELVVLAGALYQHFPLQRRGEMHRIVGKLPAEWHGAGTVLAGGLRFRRPGSAEACAFASHPSAIVGSVQRLSRHTHHLLHELVVVAIFQAFHSGQEFRVRDAVSDTRLLDRALHFWVRVLLRGEQTSEERPFG